MTGYTDSTQAPAERVWKMSETPPSSIIKSMRDISGKLDELLRDYKSKCEPYEKAYSLLESALMMKMDRDGTPSIRTLHGTAYFSQTLSVKVADREKWFAWVQDNNAWDCLTTHVAKDELKKTHGYDTPGIYEEEGLEIRGIRRLNIRKPD